MKDAQHHHLTFASAGMGQDILYLKWDLQHFLDGKAVDLLPAALVDQIGRLIPHLAADTQEGQDAGEIGAGIDSRIATLKATAHAVQRALTDIAADEALRDGSVTLRRQLVRSELRRTLARMTQFLSQLEGPSPDIVS